MKHFYLIVNREKKNAERGAALVSEYLAERGCRCFRSDKKLEGSTEYRYTDGREIPPETEGIIVLGGDGTMIQAARDLYGRELPLFGINMGNLGYLTQVSRESEIIPALDELIADHYRKETRMMLCGKVCSAEKSRFEDLALNDIILSRTGIDAIRFSLYVDDQLFSEYSADGLIVSTPTGSTAYNLSAGGPIAAPEADLMILTPICPHTLTSRSIVLSAESRLSIRIGGRAESGQAVSFDGESVTRLQPGDRIEIEKSKRKTTLIQLQQKPFLENIRNKMKQI